GRGAVEESVLARALLSRVGNDIAASLPPMVPPPAASGGGSGGSTGSGGAAGSTGAAGSGAAGSSSGGTSSNTSSSSSSTTSSMTSNLNGPVHFNLGLQGDNTRVVIYTKRVPRELDPTVMDVNNLPLVCDLRRVTYWLAGGSGAPAGLARQE